MAATLATLFLMGKMEDKIRKDLRRRAKMYPGYLEYPKSFPPQPLAEKTVYIRANNPSQETIDWYAFKLSSNARSSSPPGSGRKRKRGGKGEEATTSIKPILENAETPWSGCCVSLGSTIYCIGGGEFYGGSSRNVIASDAVGGGQWSDLIKMKASRARAQAVTAGDKIYVFGGVGKGNNNEVLKPCGPQIEVIDPIKKTRESVEPPPVPFDFNFTDGEFFVIYEDHSQRIISGSFRHGVLLAYDMTKGGGGSWEVIDPDFGFQADILSGPASFDSSLYWITMDDDGELELCLIWHDGAITVGCGDYHSLIKCSRIIVSKKVDKQKLRIRLRAYSLSTNTYVLPRTFYIMDAVVLQGTPGEEEVLKQENSTRLGSAESWHFH